MFFGELAVALSLSDIGSERAALLEQELSRRLVGQRRPKSRHAAALWFLVGGLVAIAGFQLGSGMRALAIRAAAPAVASAFLPVQALPQLRAN